MGNESSTLIDEKTPPSVLEARTIEAIAKYVKQKPVKRVVVMVGAGISTSAGIPDFRSPDTGIYSNLAHLDLPDPEAVFDISFFRQNPRPFYALARELAPGQFRPTIAHSFIKLLYDKGMLLKHFSQNIDCLERLAGVPGDKIVEAHGSFATQHCIDCKAEYPEDLMKKAITKGKVPYCTQCKGLVKPDIVFFGESLPADFFDNRDLPEQADLCIVMGTSLQVQPFASPDPAARAAENASPQTREERLQDEVDRLTEEVDRTLGISQAYQQRVRQHLERQSGTHADAAGRKEKQAEEENDRIGGLAHVFPHLARMQEGR